MTDGPSPQLPPAGATLEGADAPRVFGATNSPDLDRILRTEYRLILRSICTTGRLVAIGVLALLSTLTAIISRAVAAGDATAEAIGFVNGNVATLLPVAVLVFGSASLGDLIDDGSLVYLWLRPVPMWLHAVAAWLATITVVVPLVLGPMVLSAAIIQPDGEVLGAAIIGGLIGITAYAAIFVMAGVRFRRALPWGLVYILIWEGFVASAGKTASKLAVRSYIRSILSEITGVQLKLGDFSLAIGIIVPLLIAAAALAYASRRLGKADVA